MEAKKIKNRKIMSLLRTVPFVASILTLFLAILTTSVYFETILASRRLGMPSIKDVRARVYGKKLKTHEQEEQ